MNLPVYSSPTMRQSSPTVPKILNSFWTILLCDANGHKWQSDWTSASHSAWRNWTTLFLSINRLCLLTTKKFLRFVCLSRQDIKFGFDLRNTKAKNEISGKLKSLLRITSGSNVRTQTKLQILKRFIPSRFSFHLRLYNFGSTWIDLHPSGFHMLWAHAEMAETPDFKLHQRNFGVSQI